MPSLHPWQGPALVLLAGLLWSTAGITAKALMGDGGIAPAAVGFWRIALGWPALLVALLVQFRGHLPPRPRGRSLWGIGLVGLCVALYQASYFAAVQAVGVTIATLVALCLPPALVALVASTTMGERLGWFRALCIALAMLGVGLLVGEPADGNGGGGTSIGTTASDRVSPWLGASFALGAAAAYAGLALLGRVLGTGQGTVGQGTVGQGTVGQGTVGQGTGQSPMLTLCGGFGVGALLLLPWALLNSPTLLPSADKWPLLVFLGLVPTAGAYTAFFHGVRFTSATLAALLTLSEPLSAALLAWWLFGEALTLVGLLGAALMLVAMAGFAWKRV